MKRFYEKSKLAFTLTWIAAYLVLFTIAENISTEIGIRKIITAPLSVFFVLVLVVFVMQNKLMEEYSFCKFQGSYSKVLFFLPLLMLLCVNLRNGLAWDGTVLEAVLSVVAMLCVGFIEETLFRGFLFKTMCEDSVKAAMLVSSLTFGMGHILNLLNGSDLVPTLLQICYAAAIGFLLAMLVYKGKSLLPCIVFHSLFNVLGVFHASGSGMQSIISSAVLCVVPTAYALWLARQAEI